MACSSHLASGKSRLSTAFTLASLLCTAGLIAGCSTASGKGGAKGLLSARPASSASYISALQGGIVDDTGAKLSDSDKARALEAEYRALEGSGVGQTVSWKGDAASGEVIASAPYQVGQQNCRQYRHTVTVDGKALGARGAACRNADGTWSPLN